MKVFWFFLGVLDIYCAGVNAERGDVLLSIFCLAVGLLCLSFTYGVAERRPARD